MSCSSLEFFFLFVSTILQLVCIFAPGWWIYSSKSTGEEVFSAMFYLIEFKNSRCDLRLWENFEWKNNFNDPGSLRKNVRAIYCNISRL